MANRIVALLFGLCVMCSSSTSSAVELIPQGAAAKSSAGAGLTTVTGPMALFYNPANLAISARFQTDFDISIAKYQYEYVHTDQSKFKPVVISDTVPPIGLGASAKLSEQWTLGLSLFPTGVGEKQIIIDIPLYLGDGLYQIADVELVSSGSKVVFGSSYRPTPWMLIGMSLFRIEEKSDTSVFKAGEVYPFLRTISEGVFYHPIFGLRTNLNIPALAIGFSFSPMLLKKYKGKFLFDLTGDDQAKGIYSYHPTKQVEALPMTIGLGVKWRVSTWSIFSDLVYEAWKQGQKLVTRGLPIASPKQDLKNTLNIYVGGSYKLNINEFSLAVGNQPSNLGDGLKYVKQTSTFFRNSHGFSGTDHSLQASGQANLQQDSAQTVVEGMTFGNISGLSRTIISLGWQRPFRFLGAYDAKTPGFGSVTLYSMSGSRTVPPGYSQEGRYRITINMVNFGVTYRM